MYRNTVWGWVGGGLVGSVVLTGRGIRLLAILGGWNAGGGEEESYFGTYSRAVLSFVSNEGKRKKWKGKKRKMV